MLFNRKIILLTLCFLIFGMSKQPVFASQTHVFQVLHDGVKLEYQVSLEKDTFLLLQYITGTVRIKNTSPETIHFENRKSLWWVIEDERKKIYKHPDVAIKFGSYEIKPGEVIKGQTELDRMYWDENGELDFSYRNPRFPIGKYTAYYGPDTVPFIFNVIIDPTSKKHRRRKLYWEFDETHHSSQNSFDTTLGVPIEMEWHDNENVFGKDLIKLSYTLMEKHKELFGLEDPSSELKPGYSAGDEISQVLELDQLYKGIPVSGGGVRIHFSHRLKKRYVTGAIHPDIDIPTTPRIDKKFAILKALRNSKLPSDYESFEKRGSPSASLIVFPFEKKYYLVWFVEIYIDNSPSGWEYFIDALTGKIIHRTKSVQWIIN